MIITNIPEHAFFLLDTVTDCIVAFSIEGRLPMTLEAKRLSEYHECSINRFSILSNGHIRG